jgi:hypothetical protein
MKKYTPLRKLIGIHAPGWLDEFETQIAALWEKWPDANMFALFDCVFNEHCDTVIKKSRLASRCLYDLSNDPSPELQAVSPTLVPLTPATATAWREAAGHTDGYPMLSIIATPESLDELALRLHPWCIVNADGEPYVFRFPDTRRLPGVVDALTPQQHGAFFGPAHAWRYRTRSTTWAELPLPKAPLPPAEEAKLDADQFAQLMDDSEADQIIEHLHVHEPALIRPYHPAEACERIAQALKRADRYGIGQPDRVQWCSLFVQQPQLERIPEAMPLLAALASKKCSFGEIEGQLTDLVEGTLPQ